MANPPTTTDSEAPDSATPVGPACGKAEEPPLVPRPGDPRWRRVRRAGRGLLVLAALALGLLAVHRPLLIGYARLFEVNDPAPCDAIVMLLGGLRDRPDHAAALYRQGIAPRVVLATLDDDYGGDEETSRTLRKLMRAGVPREAITVLPDQVESTQQEALAVRREATRAGWSRITVITSDFHTRRARRVFRNTLVGTGVTVHTAASHDSNTDATNWWKSDEGLVRYVNETIKTLYYWLRF